MLQTVVDRVGLTPIWPLRECHPHRRYPTTATSSTRNLAMTRLFHRRNKPPLLIIDMTSTPHINGMLDSGNISRFIVAITTWRILRDNLRDGETSPLLHIQGTDEQKPMRKAIGPTLHLCPIPRQTGTIRNTALIPRRHGCLSLTYPTKGGLMLKKGQCIHRINPIVYPQVIDILT